MTSWPDDDEEIDPLLELMAESARRSAAAVGDPALQSVPPLDEAPWLQWGNSATTSTRKTSGS